MEMSLKRHLFTVITVLLVIICVAGFSVLFSLKESIMVSGLIALILILISFEFKLEYLVLLMLITGFFGSIIVFFRVGSISVFPFRGVLGVFCLAFPIYLFRHKKISHLKPIFNYLFFLVFWFLFAIFSMAWSLNLSDAIKNIFFLFGGIAIIFGMTFVDPKYIVEKTTKIWTIIYSFFIGFAYVERIIGYHLPYSMSNSYLWKPMKLWPTAVFRNPNDFATFLAISLPFALILLFSKKILFRLWGIFLASSSIYFIIFVSSRANMLAVVLEIIVLLLVGKIKRKWLYVSISMVVFLIICVLFWGTIQIYLLKIYDQIYSLFEEFSQQKGSTSTRINLIKNGLYFLSQKPLLGVGAGNIEYYMEYKKIVPTGDILNIHNWWAEILVNYGVIIFIMYLVYYGSILRNLYLIGRKNYYARAMFIGLVGFVLASISSSSIIAMTFIWIFFGLALSIIAQERSCN